MNHGHRLWLGILLRPDDDARADADVAAAALAVRAEELGYDLVVVPDDSPGDDAVGVNAIGHDTTGHDTSVGADAWTLLSWIAARTSRIGLVAGALRSSERSPSVIARSAASLDLLSGGRVTVGIDAAAAAQHGSDGPGPSAAEHADAAADALGVVRAMWDTSEDEAEHDGAHHRVDGAAPGPVPAHDVGIWVHGDDAAAVRLAGRRADGWVGALGAGGPAGLASLLATLDAAAASAGREPGELRRVVVVRAPVLADLLTLVVDHGVDTVVVDTAAGGAEVAERFARDVAPALRAAAARASGPVEDRPVRRAEVRARRRDGIDYDLPAALAGTAVEPGDPAYSRVRSTYMRGGRPGLVLRPRSVDEVVEAVAYARRHTHLPLGVRSGGHGISGRSTNDGGIVIDVGALDAIEVLDERARLVRVGPGARWKAVAAALDPYGWAVSSGDYGGVGVGGLATAGGIGFLSRQHGLTIDHLRAVEVVLADGSLVRASATENPDLFWAVRGAGANVGIVVAFELEAAAVGDVGWAQLAFQVADPAAYLEEFGRVASSAPRDTTAFLIMGRTQPGRPGIAQVMAMVDSDDPDVVVARLQPFAEIAPMVQQRVTITSYASVMGMAPDGPHAGRGEPVSRSGFLREITPEVAAASARLLAGGAAHWYQIRTLGGATTDVATDAMAYAHRDAQFSLTVMGADAARLDRAIAPLRELFDGLYLSFETDTSPERVADAFPEPTLGRLRELKARYDPESLFRDNFSVTPAGGDGTACIDKAMDRTGTTDGMEISA